MLNDIIRKNIAIFCAMISEKEMQNIIPNISPAIVVMRFIN